MPSVIAPAFIARFLVTLCKCLAIACGFVLGTFATEIGTTHAQSRPDYYDEVTRIIDGIRAARRSPGEPEQPLPDERSLPEPAIDYAAPALALSRIRETLDNLRANSSKLAKLRLRDADLALARTWRALIGGSKTAQRRSTGTEHLNVAQDELHTALSALALIPGKESDPVDLLKADISQVSRRIATDIYQVAMRAGVEPRKLRPIARLLDLGLRAQEEKRYFAAVALYGASTILSGGTIDFDIDQFEQNIRDGLDGEAIGYTYAITLFETVHASDGVGFARLDADLPPGEPQVPQSPDKEMFVASVSKTLTAILVLRILEEAGLSVDDPIGPWLPPNWNVSDEVAAQTFRDFLTHETGFTQMGVDPDSPNTLQFLENAVDDVPTDTSFNYNNANFGIFRVILPRLAGFDFDAFAGYTDEELYAGFFVYAALNIFENVDASVTCNISQPTPTVYYGVPHDGFNGFQAMQDYSEECGGYGFIASAEDLAAILADLQAGDDLISDQSVMLMKEHQLGFFDPVNFPYFWGNGGLGIYHNHGGDWYAGSKGVDTCIMLYPNGVSATLMINSNGGNYGGLNLYQCDLLRHAFDNAWEPV